MLSNKEMKTLRGLGLPFYKDTMSHGHLYFEFVVVFPKAGEINADREKALRQAFKYESTNKGMDKK